jgi:predicted unusual protein kinase regulating ubiquinone biosynthesis (AarF/ABC1/UbiB family)
MCLLYSTPFLYCFHFCTAPQEIDYTREGRNADRFRENFTGVDWVKVPSVFWQYSTPEVLVLEYVPGVKINNAEAIDAMGLERAQLARLAVESYLQQILRHGFFHAGEPGVLFTSIGCNRIGLDSLM